MFVRIKAWLNARALRRAREARALAYDAVRDAERRGDDRDLGKARMAFVEATADLLRIEVTR